MTYDWNDMKEKLDTAISTGVGLEDAWDELEEWRLRHRTQWTKKRGQWERIDRQLLKAIDAFHDGQPLSHREAQMMIYVINQINSLSFEYGTDLYTLIRRAASARYRKEWNNEHYHR